MALAKCDGITTRRCLWAATGGDAVAALTALAGGGERHCSGPLGGVAATLVEQVVPAVAEEGFGPEQREGTGGGGAGPPPPPEEEGMGAATPVADASAIAAGGTGAPGGMGQAEALPKSFPMVQGLVFGTYAEVSEFGHTLVEEAAQFAASRDLMVVGARSRQEAWASFWVSSGQPGELRLHVRVLGSSSAVRGFTWAPVVPLSNGAP